MKNKKYEVIVFDLGNTIIKFDHNIAAKKLSNLFRHDSKKIYDSFFDSNLTRDFEKGLVSPKEFHKKMSEHLGIKLPYKDFVAIWNDIFWADEDACEIVRQLKKTYKLFLLSNVNRLHFEYIAKKFEIIKIFDELVLSYVLGAMKPERVVFEHVVKLAGGDRTKLLYIDDREDLIKEATTLEIDSIRFENAGKLKEILHKIGVI